MFSDSQGRESNMITMAWSNSSDIYCQQSVCEENKIKQNTGYLVNQKEVPPVVSEGLKKIFEQGKYTVIWRYF